MTQSDEHVDRLLAALHRGDDGGVSPDCLDGETLAAWMDGQLGGPALARAEAHAAACGHCQAMLAAMARTAGAAEAPETGAPSRSWFRRALPWAAPLTAAATAAAVYIAVRPPAILDETRATSMAQSKAAPESGGVTLPEASGRPSDASRDQQARAADLTRPAQRTPGARADSPQTAAPPALPGREGRTEIPEASKPLADVAPAVPLPAAPAAAPTEARRRAGGQTGTPEPAGSAQQKDIRPPPAESSRAGFARPAEALAERVADPAAVAIATSDPSIRWRLVAGSAVERSTDGGVTWAAQHTEAGAGLTAGAAPSPDVCWIAGRGGTVLRTLDGGRTWNRVEFPEQADLTRIVATSADAAAVTARDGRTFTTTDGGRTWVAGRR